MTTSRDLTERAKRAGTRAQALLDRSKNLAERARGFNPAPPVVQPAKSLDQIHTILDLLAQSGVDQVTNQLKAWEDPFDGIADSISKLTKRVDELPETLEERSIGKVQELAEDVADQLEEQITSIRDAFNATAERVEEMVETSRERLDNLTESMSSVVEASISDLQEVVDRSRQDVDQVITTLESTRRAVLTICRALGIGASTARPAVEASISAFSSVA